MSDVLACAADVRFDFHGSLQLARELWSFADMLEGIKRSRGTDEETALSSWTGPKARQFEAAATEDATELTRLAAALRSEANAWALCWAQATNMQNDIEWERNNYQLRAEFAASERSFYEAFRADGNDGPAPYFGSYIAPPRPQPVVVPTAPGFTPA